jgi:2-dehydropantoate 2-reductase
LNRQKVLKRCLAKKFVAMHFIVLGAGAIGCYVGGRLAAAGQQVTLVGRPRTIDPLRVGGLTVTDLDGFSAYVPAERLGLLTGLHPDIFRAPAVVLLCVKGGATASASTELSDVCPAGTTVVSLQNGVDNMDRIAQAAPGLNAVAGMVPYNVVMPAPCKVHRGTSGNLHMRRTPVTSLIQAALQQAGLPVTLADDMRSVQWGKLLLNLNNPVNALSDMPLRAQLMVRGYRKVVAALQEEALAALDKAGIAPAKVATAPPRLLPAILRLPDWWFTRIAARMLRMDENARSSMWDDIQLGRTTEIDDLCGAVVRLGQAHGVTTPLNAAMCKLIQTHRAGKGMAAADLCRALGI